MPEPQRPVGDIAQYNGTNVPILIERWPIRDDCTHAALAWDDEVGGRLRCLPCGGVWRFDVKRARAALRWRRGRRRLQKLAALLCWLGAGAALASSLTPDIPAGWLGLALIVVGALIGAVTLRMPTGRFDA